MEMVKPEWPVHPDDPPLVAEFIALLGCDTARISRFPDMMFLIIGYNRTTQQDTEEHGGVWTDGEGNVRNWSYVAEQTVASGATVEELRASAQKYKRICGMTMEEYLLEMAGQKL